MTFDDFLGHVEQETHRRMDLWKLKMPSGACPRSSRAASERCERLKQHCAAVAGARTATGAHRPVQLAAREGVRAGGAVCPGFGACFRLSELLRRPFRASIGWFSMRIPWRKGWRRGFREVWDMLECVDTMMERPEEAASQPGPQVITESSLQSGMAGDACDDASGQPSEPLPAAPCEVDAAPKPLAEPAPRVRSEPLELPEPSNERLKASGRGFFECLTGRRCRT